MRKYVFASLLLCVTAYAAEVNVVGMGKCNYTNVSGDGAGNVTYTCVGSSSTSTNTSQINSTTSCSGVPGGWQVLDESTVPSYKFNSSTFTFITSIQPKQGYALKVTINPTSYPNGWKIADMVGGAKTYVLSTCPGSNESVNKQKCGLGSYVRYEGYNNQTNLKIQNTCFIPKSGVLYLNVFNPGVSPVGIQQANLAQMN